ncbi:MAG TPA: FAD-dependent oxidoreductase [Nevskiaceae bacterium]|nr:FAD-dependent oxidoreductase [Nevskiaceae bacterium]
MTISRNRRSLLKALGLAGAACAVDAAAATPAPRKDVRRWDRQADVVIVGTGAAGISAAIEVRRAGGHVEVLESVHVPGGSSSISGGVCYLGGGTPLQKALGFDDTTDAMIGYMLAASGPSAPVEKIRLYCEGSLEHFDWLVANGVVYAQKFSPEKEITIPDGSLYYCGSEKTWPYRDQFRPAPRGHVPPSQHLTGGRVLMAALLASAAKLGVEPRLEHRARRLVVESDGRVSGVLVEAGGRTIAIGAKRGVLLSAGGFIHNAAMVKRYAPELAACTTPWGRAGDLGDGILMGMAAGGAINRMHEGFIITPMYPPESILKGIAVNRAGLRFHPEDSYYGMIGHAIAFRQEGVAFMITDADSAYAWKDERLPIAAKADTIAALEKALQMPEGALVGSVDYYNTHARKGEDPLFHKAREFVAPLAKAPFTAYDLSVGKAFTPAHTFGGLQTSIDAQVLNAWGDPIPGLYAAGRTSAGLPVAPYIGSGVSIGDGTFFGRRAGRHAMTAKVT